MAPEQKIFNFVLWCFAGFVLLILLTSCSAYQVPQIATRTTQPTIQPTQSHTPTPRPITCTVNAERVYLRAGAGMKYAALDVLHMGDTLQIVTAGEWLKVTSPKRAGYIYSKFCTKGK